ncbi:sigma-70 region 4 domain-containing protein [Halomicrobium urmianum]|uniref:sigma-70 region 4 domain-containing protein n=1 Tax=Halomicrobium urmianum TaxID=1586233 RepID=UPI001CD936D6|nr:sigma-70 region 4 domain-containing protein [Halomicrobium urmianum]
MSRASRPTWSPSDALDQQLGEPDRLRFPDGWQMSESWRRAQRESDRGSAVNDAERMVWLEGSEQPHRVTWALAGQTLRAECDCASSRYRGWCAHLASLWWRWIRGEIVVTHLDTGREYRTPPTWLRFGRPRDADLTTLTPAQQDAYLHVDLGGEGVREYARRTDRSPGTVGNLLADARENVGGEGR